MIPGLEAGPFAALAVLAVGRAREVAHSLGPEHERHVHFEWLLADEADVLGIAHLATGSKVGGA
jgi:hypothetical protein